MRRIIFLERLAQRYRDIFGPAFDLPYQAGSWHGEPATLGQQRIEELLLEESLAGKAILHVGIGNSQLAQRFCPQCLLVDGLTIMPQELRYARRLNLANYQVYLLNKHSNELKSFATRYDYIVDNNLSSFAPHNRAFFIMMENYCHLLKQGGKLLTDSEGMGYCDSYAFRIDDNNLRSFEKLLPLRFFVSDATVRGSVKL